jgi:hypothetical protein
MKKIIILLALTFIFISCKKDSSETKKAITISGKLISSESKIVYLKMIDNFNYLTNNYLIDSTTVSSEGKFEFRLDYLPSNLLTLSTNNYQPISYRVLTQMPDKYYFGGCALSFASEPTLYLAENDSVNIEWFDNKHLDSIIHKTDIAKNQNIMQKYYANIGENIAGNLDRENLLDYQTAWDNVLNDQKKDLKSIDIAKIDIVDSFENYIYSEITLFNLNMYLNWFEDAYPDKVKSAIINLNESDLYNKIFAKYSDHLWNPKSFDYYKFTERFVNYNMNIKNQSFKTYYKPSKEKRKVAEKVLKGKNKERYLSILDEQIKNVL